mmetsp:Transcript_105320/g.339344  ORF Transcript_105320/g.339344 Transcript_105320/m.339344 type:complete len:129 (-) Transcript_105320:115-501(-)
MATELPCLCIAWSWGVGTRPRVGPMPDAKGKAIDGALVSSMLTNVAVKAAFGSLAFIPGCVVFRGAALRCLCGGLGMGFGAGMAWTQADLHLRHPELVPMPASLTSEAERMKAEGAARMASLRARIGF